MKGAVWPIFLLACGGSGPPQPKPSGTASTDVLIPSDANAGPDVEGPVGMPITFDGSASTGVSFTWDFGDGTTAEGAVVTHTYQQPGNYTAVLEVQGSDASTRTDVVLAVAYVSAADPPVVNASTLVVDEQERAWVVVPEAGLLARLSETAVGYLGVCARPQGVAVDGGTVRIACDDDRVVSVNASTFTVTEDLALSGGSHPVGVVAHDGTWWMALASGEVGTVDDTAFATAQSLPDPRGLSVGPHVVATRYRSTDGVGLLAVDDARLFIDPDPGPDSDTVIRGVPTALAHLSVSPDGGVAYLTGSIANTGRGEYLEGQPLTFETTVRGFVEAVALPSGDRLWRKQLDDHGLTGATALSPRGNYLFVAAPTQRDITVLDAYSGDVVGSLLDVGLGIRGLAVQGDTLFVHAWLERELTAWDISDLSSPVLRFQRSTVQAEPLFPDVYAGLRVFWDSTDTRMAKSGYLACATCHPDGEHDGLTWDFTARGEGLRNTTSLLGRAGLGMGPLHWTGNFDEVQDFEHDIRERFGGDGFLSEADWSTGTVSEPLGDPKAGLSQDLDDLAAYVTSLDQAPASPNPVEPTGESLFFLAGCAGCHPAPLYTDSPLGVRHDVGTLNPGTGARLGESLDGLDTPTLLGVWQTPPYLHDGSAPTLEDAIAAHDIASMLSASEVAAIAAFVGSL